MNSDHSHDDTRGSRLTAATLAVVLALGGLAGAGCGGGGDSDSGGDSGGQSPGQAQTTGGGERDRGSAGSADREGGEGDGGSGGSPDDGGPAPEVENERPAKSPLPDSAADWIGLFTTQVSAREANDLRGEFATEGRWVLVLGRGSYELSSKGKGSQGRLRVTGEEMTFRPSDGPAGRRDPCGRDSGTYRWSVSDQRLALEPSGDDCEGRRAILSKDWSQQQ